MNVIKKGFSHPKLKIYCNECRNQTECDNNVKFQLNEGIFHSKLILITTPKCLRLLIMTANFTWNLIENNTNDLYRLTTYCKDTNESIEFNEESRK